MSVTPFLDGLRKLRSEHYATFRRRAEVVLFNSDLLDDIAKEIALTAGGVWRHPWEDEDTFLARMKADLLRGQVSYMGINLRFDP